jgi:hypothetical protein
MARGHTPARIDAMKLRLAALALILTACGADAPVRESHAGGDPGTVAAPPATPTPEPEDFESFQTPSGRLRCTVSEQALVCQVTLLPSDTHYPEPNIEITPECEELAPKQWGNGVRLPADADAYPLCATDVQIPDPNPPALTYGKTWERDGFTCTSEEQGLTCNSGRHVFFANRDAITITP